MSQRGRHSKNFADPGGESFGDMAALREVILGALWPWLSFRLRRRATLADILC